MVPLKHWCFRFFRIAGSLLVFVHIQRLRVSSDSSHACWSVLKFACFCVCFSFYQETKVSCLCLIIIFVGACVMYLFWCNKNS